MALGPIVAAIDGLPPAQFAGAAYRHQAREWQYSQPGAGARTQGGRWNPPNSFATLYLGLSVQTVAAEFHRMAGRFGRSPNDFMPRHLLEYAVELNALVDLSRPDALGAVGLTKEQLRADDPTACQEVGEAAHHLGREGILAPSSTGEGRVLAVFIERLHPSSVVDVASTIVWETPPSEPAR